MGSTPFKVSVVLGSLGVSGVSGFGAYSLFFKKAKSIKDHIQTLSYYHGYSFFKKEDSRWEAIKTEYEKSESSYKPMGNDGKAVKKDDLPYWCSKNLMSEFTDEKDSKYQSVLRWCYLNDNSFEKQMQSLKRQLKGVKNETPSSDAPAEWQTAWDEYSQHKSDINSRIASDDADLNGMDKAKGSKALQKWCSLQLKSLMYSNDAFSKFGTFNRWCTK
ncbi:hypothetical protein MHC_02165 [Mycoplasma haemocanis str. Illinois]|uniref:Uncharacterized protein n=1 Tax=Mycoplasma haemocanis (strain Illinois) TaxID=1111676 RepID=H6N6M7_MYCHN|nr:hypothetical protein [Mycoplasma haemocanis]AEW45299.1 hypothetical protein MHC_02165 [Mycoplasma haemocanis str. Illinois]